MVHVKGFTLLFGFLENILWISCCSFSIFLQCRSIESWQMPYLCSPCVRWVPRAAGSASCLLLIIYVNPGPHPSSSFPLRDDNGDHDNQDSDDYPRRQNNKKIKPLHLNQLSTHVFLLFFLSGTIFCFPALATGYQTCTLKSFLLQLHGIN